MTFQVDVLYALYYVSDKCAAGTFSRTGYAPCTVCPLHHYQESIGMMSCDPCNSDQITLNNSTSNSSYCVDGGENIYYIVKDLYALCLLNKSS